MSVSLRTTAPVVSILLVCLALPPVRRTFFPDVAAGTWIVQGAFVALPLLALRARAPRELGLDRVNGRGVAVGVLGSLLMAAALFATGSRLGMPSTTDLVQGALLAPLAEEILFRGYALRRLHVRAGWPLWPALLVTAILFGLGHIAGAAAEGEKGNVVSTVLVTAAGGAWMGWLFIRWGYSLWVSIAVHATMNLWWLLFSAGPTAGSGGPGALWGRVATITAITLATLRWTRRGAEPKESGPL